MRACPSILFASLCLLVTSPAWATTPLYATYQSSVTGAPPCARLYEKPGNVNSEANARFQNITMINSCVDQTLQLMERTDGASLQKFEPPVEDTYVDLVLDDLAPSTLTTFDWTLSGQDGEVSEEGVMTLMIECVEDCGQGEDQGNVGCSALGSARPTDMSLGLFVLMMGGLCLRRRVYAA